MSYILMFRTHVWDEFTRRSFERLRAQALGGDVCILADETNGPVPCPSEWKIPHSAQAFASMGLTIQPPDRTLWYNGDYPLYSAYTAYPNYDYYIMTEFDVVVNARFDDVIAALKLSKGDAVTHAPMKARDDWIWRDTAESIYGQVYGSINALVVLSKRAVAHLFEARRILSQRFTAGEIDRWPYCEAFIASELYAAGFAVQELKDFGSVQHFSWWPPTREDIALSDLRHEAFIHPVLTGEAYIRSLTRYELVDHVPVERGPGEWERAVADSLRSET